MSKQELIFKERPELINEVLTLKDLGLKDYEINYLLHLKMKQEARTKWE